MYAVEWLDREDEHEEDRLWSPLARAFFLLAVTIASWLIVIGVVYFLVAG